MNVEITLYRRYFAVACYFLFYTKNKFDIVRWSFAFNTVFLSSLRYRYEIRIVVRRSTRAFFIINKNRLETEKFTSGLQSLNSDSDLREWKKDIYDIINRIKLLVTRSYYTQCPVKNVSFANFVAIMIWSFRWEAIVNATNPPRWRNRWRNTFLHHAISRSISVQMS